MLDLRPAKQMVGLAITYPDHDYQELIDLAVKRSRKKVKKSAPKKKVARPAATDRSSSPAPTEHSTSPRPAPSKSRPKKQAAKKGGLLASLFGKKKRQAQTPDKPAATSKPETAAAPASPATTDVQLEADLQSSATALENLKEQLPPQTPEFAAQIHNIEQSIAEATKILGDLASRVASVESTVVSGQQQPAESPSHADEIRTTESAAEESIEAGEGRTTESPEAQDVTPKQTCVGDVDETSQEQPTSDFTPEVLDFSDCAEGLEAALDEMLGDSEITVEAVSLKTSEVLDEIAEEIEIDFDFEDEQLDTATEQLLAEEAECAHAEEDKSEQTSFEVPPEFEQICDIDPANNSTESVEPVSEDLSGSDNISSWLTSESDAEEVLQTESCDTADSNTDTISTDETLDAKILPLEEDPAEIPGDIDLFTDPDSAPSPDADEEVVASAAQVEPEDIVEPSKPAKTKSGFFRQLFSKKEATTTGVDASSRQLDLFSDIAVGDLPEEAEVDVEAPSTESFLSNTQMELDFSGSGVVDESPGFFRFFRRSRSQTKEMAEPEGAAITEDIVELDHREVEDAPATETFEAAAEEPVATETAENDGVALEAEGETSDRTTTADFDVAEEAEIVAPEVPAVEADNEVNFSATAAGGGDEVETDKSLRAVTFESQPEIDCDSAESSAFEHFEKRNDTEEAQETPPELFAVEDAVADVSTDISTCDVEEVMSADSISTVAANSESAIDQVSAELSAVESCTELDEATTDTLLTPESVETTALENIASDNVYLDSPSNPAPTMETTEAVDEVETASAATPATSKKRGLFGFFRSRNSEIDEVQDPDISNPTAESSSPQPAELTANEVLPAEGSEADICSAESLDDESSHEDVTDTALTESNLTGELDENQAELSLSEMSDSDHLPEAEVSPDLLPTEEASEEIAGDATSQIETDTETLDQSTQSHRKSRKFFSFFSSKSKNTESAPIDATQIPLFSDLIITRSEEEPAVTATRAVEPASAAQLELTFDAPVPDEDQLPEKRGLFSRFLRRRTEESTPTTTDESQYAEDEEQPSDLLVAEGSILISEALHCQSELEHSGLESTFEGSEQVEQSTLQDPQQSQAPVEVAAEVIFDDRQQDCLEDKATDTDTAVADSTDEDLPRPLFDQFVARAHDISNRDELSTDAGLETPEEDTLSDDTREACVEAEVEEESSGGGFFSRFVLPKEQEQYEPFEFSSSEDPESAEDETRELSSETEADSPEQPIAGVTGFFTNMVLGRSSESETAEDQVETESEESESTTPDTPTETEGVAAESTTANTIESEEPEATRTGFFSSTVLDQSSEELTVDEQKDGDIEPRETSDLELAAETEPDDTTASETETMEPEEPVDDVKGFFSSIVLDQPSEEIAVEDVLPDSEGRSMLALTEQSESVDTDSTGSESAGVAPIGPTQEAEATLLADIDHELVADETLTEKQFNVETEDPQPSKPLHGGFFSTQVTSKSSPLHEEPPLDDEQTVETTAAMQNEPEETVSDQSTSNLNEEEDISFSVVATPDEDGDFTTAHLEQSESEVCPDETEDLISSLFNWSANQDDSSTKLADSAAENRTEASEEDLSQEEPETALLSDASVSKVETEIIIDESADIKPPWQLEHSDEEVKQQSAWQEVEEEEELDELDQLLADLDSEDHTEAAAMSFSGSNTDYSQPHSEQAEMVAGAGGLQEVLPEPAPTMTTSEAPDMTAEVEAIIDQELEYYRSLDCSSVNTLFDEATAELIGSEDSISFEFHAGDFIHFEGREDIHVLYNMVDEALDDPELDHVFECGLRGELVTEIASSELEKELDHFEKSVEEAALDFRSLGKRNSKESSTGRVYVGQIKTIEVELASTSSRLKAACLDLVCMTVLLLMTSLMYLWINNSEVVNRVVFSSSEAQLLDWVALISVACSHFVFWLYTYPIFMFATLGQTPGCTQAGIRLIQENGKALDWKHAIVRGLIFPLSLVLGGWIPLIANRHSMHDRLAKTLLHVDLPAESSESTPKAEITTGGVEEIDEQPEDA